MQAAKFLHTLQSIVFLTSLISPKLFRWPPFSLTSVMLGARGEPGKAGAVVLEWRFW